MVGYDSRSKAYRHFDPHTKKIVMSRDVLFNESEVGLPLAPAEPLFGEGFRHELVSRRPADKFREVGPQSCQLRRTTSNMVVTKLQVWNINQLAQRTSLFTSNSINYFLFATATRCIGNATPWITTYNTTSVKVTR